jgi:EpsI family protein
MPDSQRWIPAVLLVGGVVLAQFTARQHPIPLGSSLSSIPTVLDGVASRELPVSPEEQRVAGMTSYVSRLYGPDSLPTFSLYVGYYESQTQGRTIHSPKNCLPGAGWEPVEAGEARIATASGSERVNRYVIANRGKRAVVYYWYQGRGRVTANEYLVKWHLLRDASIRRRSDEALIRIIVPVTLTDQAADEVARRVASTMIPVMSRILPS